MDDRFSSGYVNMAKIYEHHLSTNILREKRRHSFNPQHVNLFGEYSICMVNLLETPRVRVFFFFFITWLTYFGCFRGEVFVFSSEHENQNVATLGTLLDQFMLSCK